MKKASHTFVALYDASPEHAHFTNPIMASRARALGKALAMAELAGIARLGSPVMASVFEALNDMNAMSVVLSPASSRAEHQQAYRLPFVSLPLIFTGKGATGTDMIALESAHAMIVFGSYPQVLENILETAKDSLAPIGVLSDEEPADIHERIRTLYPHLTAQLYVSHDPAILVREIGGELRRRRLEAKN